MKICYIDEAGCCGALPHARSEIQPVLVIGGLIIDYGRLHQATQRLLEHKNRFFPGHMPAGSTYLGRILGEIKGAELRKHASEGGRNLRRQTFGFLDGIMDICEAADARLVGRVWVKEIGGTFDGRAVYTSSIQAIARYFHDYLARTNDLGMMIADSRMKKLNSEVAHSIFTQKFKSTGDSYDRIIELPSFGHSDNHAGIQLIDCLCSGIITPMSISTYCDGHVDSVHIRSGYTGMKARYAGRISKMQHRYAEANGRWRGGLVVSDGINSRPGRLLFAAVNTEAASVSNDFDAAAD